jgi:O-antigen ligase
LAQKATALAVATMTLAVVSAPGVTPGLLAGAALTAGLWRLIDGIGLNGELNSTAVIAFAFVGWMFASLAWSPNVKAGLPSAFTALAFTLMTLATLQWAPAVAGDARRSIARAFVAGMAVAILLVAIEVVTNMGLRRLFMSFVPSMISTTPGTRVEGGWVTFLPPFLIKKNIAVVTSLLWPALLIAHVLIRRRSTRSLVFAVTAVFVGAVMIGGHDTSKLALVVSGLVFLIARAGHIHAYRTTIALWVGASLAVVPLTLALYASGAYQAESIRFSGRHRIVLWGHTSQLVLNKPLRGAGLASTRYLDETSKYEQPMVPGTDIRSGTNVHSHNVFLQTWHELGGVGAALLSALGFAAIAGIAQAPPVARPFLYATFVATATLASLSWSLIAAWFMALFGCVAIFAQLAHLVAEHDGDP